MGSRPNILLIVVDSLRADHVGKRARTPFLNGLHERGFLRFDQAYSTACWTLPAHMSMFTGLVPAAHGANFESMAYDREVPTIAETLSAAGYNTHLITRNTIFDGSLPGVARGFRTRSMPYRPLDWWAPMNLFQALAKPRVRHLVRESGFFAPVQKGNRDFLKRIMQLGVPADDLALERVIEKLLLDARTGQPSFVFANLYDCHLPYPPSPTSSNPAPTSWDSLNEIGAALRVLPRIARHEYLRRAFCVEESDAQALRRRYRKAVELMDAKLEHFFRRLGATGLLENSVVILTSDHGEAFGEHGLWGHDASVYDVHLHVPLWIRHPQVGQGRTEDCVSTLGVHDVLLAAGDRTCGSLLLPDWRKDHPVAYAEHTPYRVRGWPGPLAPEHQGGRRAVKIAGKSKLVASGGRIQLFTSGDRHELEPIEIEPWRAERILQSELNFGDAVSAMAYLTPAR